ncbi:MAG: TolC family protein [Fibrobacter sp.]|nr:TolC family protein [Fibrobacter sp.]
MRLICLELLITFFAVCLNADSITQNQYSLMELLAIADSAGNRLEIINRNESLSRTDADMYRSELWPSIQFSTAVSYVNQSLMGQSSSGTEISRIFNRMDGYNLDWSIFFEQSVLTFGKLLNTLKMARLADKSIGYAKRFQRDSYFLEVIQQFTHAFIAQSDYGIYSETIERAQRIYNQVNTDFTAGMASKRELLLIESAMQRDQANLIEARNRMKSEKKRLAILIGLNCMIDSLYYTKNELALWRLHENNIDTGKSLELTIKELEVEQNEYQKRYARAEIFPSLNLTGSIQNSFLIIDTSGLTGRYLEYLESTGEEVDQMEVSPFAGNPGSESYFDPDFFSYSIGLSLVWNIFDRKRTIDNYKRARYAVELSRLELEQMRKEYRNSISDTKGKLFALDSMISALELQYLASKMALEQAQIDHDNRYINVVDYLDVVEESRDALRSLEQTRLQYLITQIQLRIAMGFPVYEK